MTSVALRGLTGRKLRTVLTMLAIVLGTAMISGTFVIRDQITRAFDDIFTEANAGTDVILTKKAAFETEEGGGNGGPLDASVVDTVATVDGVAAAVGQIQALGSLVVDGEYIQSSGEAPNLVISWAPKPFDVNTFVEGSPPASSGEVVVNKEMADDNDLTVGQQLGLTTDFGVEPVTISGIYTVGDSGSIGGATLVGVTLEDAQKWFDRPDQVSYVLVDGESGITPEELTQRLEGAVPSDVRVETGTENAERSTEEISGSINGFLTPLLLAFAGAAVFVGAFIIFNTFSITVAQRTREFAMLRTIGANRRQVLTSVLVEALVIGLLASLTGIVAGIGFALLLTTIFDAMGFSLPTAGIQISTTAVVVPLLVGTLIAVLAAIGPALRATRVPPIAALREGAELPHGRLHRFMPYIAGLLGVVGVLLLVQGIFGDGDTTSTLLSMALGAILVFIAVAMVSRYIIRPLARVIGWPVERLGRATGRLARENTMRNPGRTAVTASALMIGVGLVVFVAVFVNGFKDSFLGALDRSVTGDLIIETENFSSIPKQAIAAATSAPSVDAVSGLQFGEARIGDGGTDFVTGIDATTIDSVYTFDWVDGGDQTLSELTGETTIIEEQFAKSHNLQTGDNLEVTSTDDVTLDLRVVGIYDDPVLFTGFVMPAATFDRFTDMNDPSIILVNFDQGTDPQVAKQAVEGALEAYPVATVRTNDEYKANTEDQVNQFLALLYVLLGMSVIISLFGIVNTLALSVFERTREIGMLRAIGMTRRQLRRTVRWESVITAIIGGLLGIGIGLVFGWMVTKGLEDQGIEFAVPIGQLIVFLIVAALAGVVAAILPARRAARLDVLQALQYE